MGVTKDRAAEVLQYAAEHGDESAMDVFGVKEDTLRRYRDKHPDAEIEMTALLRQISERYSDKELRAIASGGQINTGKYGSRRIKRSGETHKLGVLSDTHIGSVAFRPEYLFDAFDMFASEGIDTVLHIGDVTEGMSNRPGQIYELTHIGYSEQKAYAVELMSRWGGKLYMIDGNHDRWYIKSNGAKIVEDICAALPDAEFLGHDEGDLYINGTWVKLWHGEDGSSYATSYRIQKLIEAFSGGEKPHILLTGHVHKQGYFFERNVHAISAGAVCTQSKWMRSTRKANHTGYWIIEFTENENGVSRFKPEFFPFYA